MGKLFKDPEAVELFPTFGQTTDEERAKHWVEKQLDRYANKRNGLQVLIDKKTNEFIGQWGLLLQEVDGEIEIEVAYHILKKYWGKGYAPEAAGAFIDYAFKNSLTSSVISIIDKRNIKSQRVAEKNGFTREKETKWSSMDVFVYRIANRNNYPLLHPLNLGIQIPAKS